MIIYIRAVKTEIGHIGLFEFAVLVAFTGNLRLDT